MEGLEGLEGWGGLGGGGVEGWRSGRVEVFVYPKKPMVFQKTKKPVKKRGVEEWRKEGWRGKQGHTRSHRTLRPHLRPKTPKPKNP